jgi:hypothetical protein
MEATMEISTAIRDYKAKYWNLVPMLDAFSKLDSIEDAIHHATIGNWLGFPKKPNGDFYIHPHQAQIGRERRNACRDALLAVKDELPKYKTFEELRTFIANTIPSKQKDGVAIYDMTLRIAAFLNMRPDFVYLHAGVKRGARRFGITGRKMVKVEELPNGFRKLSPEIAEDLLCIFYGHK